MWPRGQKRGGGKKKKTFNLKINLIKSIFIEVLGITLHPNTKKGSPSLLLPKRLP
jgi:hypothetical protein